MTVDEIRAKLDEVILLACEDASESHKEAPNSYGAGYDCGYRDAFKKLLNFINGLDFINGEEDAL